MGEWRGQEIIFTLQVLSIVMMMMMMVVKDMISYDDYGCERYVKYNDDDDGDDDGERYDGSDDVDSDNND